MAKSEKLVKAISAVVFVTFFAKIMGFIREAVQASVFGTQQSTDYYTLAYNDTIYLFTTVAYALCIAAIPVISQNLMKSRAQGLCVSGNLIAVTMLLAMGITVVGVIFPYQLFISDPQASQLILYVRIMFLALPVIVLTYLMVAVFQSMEHYTLQGTLSLPYNVFLIAWLVFAGERFGVLGMVIAITVAWLLQLGMTIPLLIKEQVRLSLKPQMRSGYLSGFFRTAAATGITSAVYLFCYMMDTHQAAGLDSGTVTAFYYADKLFTPLITTLVYSISTVVFPKFNQQYVKAPQEYRQYVQKIIHWIFFLALPFSVLIAIDAKPIICVLFERGDFSRFSTELTGEILGAYALGMTGFALIDLLNKAFFTMEKRMIPLVTTGIILFSNLILNTVFQSGAGLAIATVVSLSAGALVLLFLFCKGSGLFSVVISAVRFFAASAVMGGVLWWLSPMVVSLDDGVFWMIGKCLGLGMLGLMIYCGLCFLMGERWLGHGYRKEG